MRAFALLATALLTSLLSGCAAEPRQTEPAASQPNRTEQSRQNSRMGQDELSRETDKLGK